MIKMNSFDGSAPKGERLLVRAYYGGESGLINGEATYGIGVWDGQLWEVEGTWDDREYGTGLIYVCGWCRLSELDGFIERADIEGPIR